MKKRFGTFILLICAGAALAQPAQVVVPNGLANTEGNSSMSDPFNSTSFRFQQVFDASQFAFLGNGTARIDSISFRLDGASTQDVSFFFGGSSVVLSTTTRAPDGLSTVFADNRGADAKTVWNGALSIGGVAQAGAMPQPWPFAETIPITSTFFYSPSQGNLLLEIAGVAGQSFLPGELDAQLAASDSVSRVFADSNLATSGGADSLGLVTRFDVTVVPEPATWALVAAGLGIAFLFNGRAAKSRCNSYMQTQKESLSRSV